MARAAARPRRRERERERERSPLATRQVAAVASAPAGGILTLHPAVALEAGWLGIALLVPILFVPGIRDAFELPKQLTFRLWWYGALLIAGTLAIAQGRLGAHTVFTFGRWLRERRSSSGDTTAWPASPAAVAFVSGALAVALILATLCSVTPTVSFWGGRPLSTGGLRTLLGFVALFTAVALALRRESQLSTLVRTIGIAASVCALYAAAQAFGLDPFHWSGAAGASIDPRQRVAGTLGNPNFIGAYLTLSIFITAGLALAATGQITRGLWIASTTVQAIAILRSETRGAWLGVLAGTVVFAVLIVAQRRGPWQRLLLGAGALVATGTLALWLLQPYLPSTGIFGRATSIFHPTQGSAGVRLELWRMGIQTWLDRPLLGPLLGNGPETFESLVERAFSPSTEGSLGAGATRVENAVVDTVVTTGIAGLAALAAATVLPLALGVRALRRTASPLLPALLAAFAANLVSQVFLFAETGTTTLECLVAGAIAGYSLSLLREEERLASPRRTAHEPRAPRWALPAAGAAALILFGTLIWTEVTQLRASLAFDQGSAFADADRSGEAIVNLQQALDLWPRDYAFAATLAREWRNAASGLAPAAQPAAYTTAVRAAERGIAVDPIHPLVLAEWAASAGELAAVTNDMALADRARDTYARIHALAPNSAYPWKLEGATDLRLNRPQDAKQALTRATTLLRKDWQAWVLLGQASAASGDQAGARAAYREALRCAPATGQLHNELLSLAGSAPVPEPDFNCL